MTTETVEPQGIDSSFIETGAPSQAGWVQRTAVLLYGVAAYALAMGTLCYIAGFELNLLVPKSVDSGPAAGNVVWAVLANVSLILLFGIQHTIMARLYFQRWWTKIVPPAAERRTFLLFTVGVFALMFSHWQAIPAVVWHVEHETARLVLYALFGFGWFIAVLSTFLINHFDLFGLRQVYLYFRGRDYTPLPFKKIGLYKWVRHPLMLGFLIGFWAVPTMTVGHLVFSGVFSLYILAALYFEERDLTTLHGDSYKRYMEETPKLLPVGK